MLNKSYPIIGMSPGNSYFNESNINFLLNNLLNEHEEVLIMIADIPAISTYIALGYPENRARTDKAIRNSNNIKNRVLKVVNENDINHDKVRILDWEKEVESNSEYKRIYQETKKLYNNNDKFKKACNETTRAVLKNSSNKITDIDKSISIAVHYLLSELAFLEWAGDFLNQKHITYIYHSNWPVFEDYIAGIYDEKNRENYLGFRILRNPEDTR